jgi:PAS domain S-box-containing protein
MGATRGTSIRILYVAADPGSDAAQLEREHERFDVESTASVDTVRDLITDVDCLVSAHEGSVDAMAVLESVHAVAPELPVVVVTDDATTAEQAFTAGAADVCRDDPIDPATSVLAHRIDRALEDPDTAETGTAGGAAVTEPDSEELNVLDALPDVFYVLETDGSFRRWNDRLPTVTVYDEDALSGMSLTDLIAPEDRDAVATAIDRAASEGRAQTREAAVVTARGDRATYEFDIAPLTDDRGMIHGLAGTAREVTDRKLREQRLGVLARVLRHNVRNQMTVVRGRAERLASELHDDPEVAAIDRAATKLVNLSDKARRVEAALRESSTNRRPLDVVDIIERTMAALAREFPDAELTLSAPDSLTARTTEGLTFAVEELVRNSIVHNDSEPPTVEVTIGREENGNDDLIDDATPGMVAITVADDGPGIPETESVALTTGYETDLKHSTGLGLWLVNWVTTAAGGSLEYDTDDNLGGAAVTLRFPATGE